MAETKQIGRVEEVDVCVYGRQARLRVAFRLADGGQSVLLAAVTHELLVDYLGVWGEVALQDTLRCHCWVIASDSTIRALAPLLADEGQTLDLIPEPSATSSAEATTTPDTAPETEMPTMEQGVRWKRLISRARALKLDVEHCRPKSGMTRDEVEGLLQIGEGIVAGEQAAGKAVAA